jgi:hypothetical protein
MVADMMASAAFNNPLSLEEALGRGVGPGGGGGGGGMLPFVVPPGADGATVAGVGASSRAASQLPGFDGLVVVSGGRCARGGGADEEGGAAWVRDGRLRALLRTFWGAGLPCAFFGNAVLLAACCPAEGGGAGGSPSLLAGRRSAAPSGAQVWGAALAEAAFRCRWAPLGALRRARGGGAAAAAAVVTRASGGSALVSTERQQRPANLGAGAGVARTLLRHAVAWLGRGEVTLQGLRPALPVAEEGDVVVCDRNYISAQCGGDAFALGRTFIDRLESTATTY